MRQEKGSTPVDALARLNNASSLWESYSTVSLKLSAEVWPDLIAEEIPQNLRRLDGMPLERATHYDPKSLSEVLRTIEREGILETGVAAVEELARRSPRIVPKIEMYVGRLWVARNHMPEDAIAEFVKSPKLIDVCLYGRNPHAAGHQIFHWQLAPR